MGRSKLSAPSKNTIDLCQLLGVRQHELLNLLVDRFGDCLIHQINTETRHHANSTAVWHWLKDNSANDRRIVGSAIKAARYRAKLTQPQLGKMVGCGFRSISLSEQGLRLSPERIKLIAEALNDDGLNHLLSTISKSGQ